MNIYMLGKIIGTYRNKNFINSILDQKLGYLTICDYRSNGVKLLLEMTLEIFSLILCDVVYVTIMQHDSFKIKLAKFFKKYIITEFYISKYDTEVFDKKNLDRDSKEAQELRKKDKFALEKSDLVLFLNQAEAEYYCSVVDVDITKINYKIVPLVNDTKPKAKLKYFNNSRACMNLCWTGSYIPLQGLEKIIKAMSIIKTKKINVHLYIWGDDEGKASQYVNMIDEYNLKDYISIHNEWGNVNKWIDFMVENCDVNLGIFGDSLKAKSVVANKVIDGISFQCPVLTGKSRGLDCYFDGRTDIFIVDNSPEQIATEIELIYKMEKEVINQRIENSYNIYKSFFCVENYYNSIRDIFGGLQRK